MTSDGKTGINQHATGNVGKYIQVFRTKDGRLGIKFDLACGENKPEVGKYPTWRHCIAYGENAEILRGIKQGMLVKIHGWTATEARRDGNGETVYEYVDEHYKKPILEEHIIAFPKSAEIVDKTKIADRQLTFVGNADNN